MLCWPLPQALVQLLQLRRWPLPAFPQAVGLVVATSPLLVLQLVQLPPVLVPLALALADLLSLLPVQDPLAAVESALGSLPVVPAWELAEGHFPYQLPQQRAPQHPSAAAAVAAATAVAATAVAFVAESAAEGL